MSPVIAHEIKQNGLNRIRTNNTIVIEKLIIRLFEYEIGAILAMNSVMLLEQCIA